MILPVGFGSEEAAGGYQIERSLRFNSADSANLTRTPASASNRTTWTLSFWCKRSGLGGDRIVLNAGTTGSTDVDIFFPSDQFMISDRSGWNAKTTQVFRDTSAWYHLMVVLDTTQATSTNRIKMYVNGEQITSFVSPSYPSQNATSSINNNVTHYIGTRSNNDNYFNGYLTEINFIDGSALTPTDFGEFNTDTGVWQPIEYTGSYGTNGFYLNFSDNASTTTLGDDLSGNGNDWTTNNFSVTAGAGNDSLVDTPTNYGEDTGVGGEVRGNYATWNPLDKGGDITLSNGNLAYTGSANSNGWRAVRGTVGLTSGKWRFSCAGTVGFSSRMNFGIARSTADVSSYFTSQNIGIQYAPYDALVYVDGSSSSYGGTTYRSTYTFDCFIDCDNKKIWFAVDGTVLGSGDPNTGANPAATWSYSDPVFPVTQCYGGNWDSNFGQRPFDFTVSSASTFKALCTQNLPEPTIVDGEEYFNAVLWTGNGSDPRNITGVGFAPDFVWGKSRSAAYNHRLYDIIRGAQKALLSNATDAETAADDTMTAFLSDGFTVKNSLNTNTDTYVAWNWKANGAGVGGISSNATSGFMIANITTSTTADVVINHGLGVAPEFIILKNREGGTSGGAANHWIAWHKNLTLGYIMTLNGTDGQFNTASYAAITTAPTSTQITVDKDATRLMGVSGDDAIVYAFAPVPGYSAFGSYTGNGSADGPFVFCGFRPRYVLIKNASATGDWFLYDTARNTYNVADNRLKANLADAEGTGGSYGPDILSNGFKMRSDFGELNGSGNTIIYAAFAENPYKVALAR